MGLERKKSSDKKTDIKYQVLPDGKYATSGNTPSSHNDPQTADDEEDEPPRHYDCFDRCGR